MKGVLSNCRIGFPETVHPAVKRFRHVVLQYINNEGADVLCV